MEESTTNFSQLAVTSKHFARRLLTIGENRLELLAVEVAEERERLVRGFLLALGTAVFSLLAGCTLSAAVVVWLWPYSPVAVLLALTLLYAAAGFFIYDRLNAVMQGWQTLSGSISQLRKDRECVEKILA